MYTINIVLVSFKNSVLEMDQRIGVTNTDKTTLFLLLNCQYLRVIISISLLKDQKYYCNLQKEQRKCKPLEII